MTVRSPRLMVGICLVALLTVTAGCASIVADDPDPERIADELEDRQSKIDDVQGTQVTTIERDGSINRTVVEVVERPPSESRREVIESDTQWQSAGDVIVRNEETMISYNAEENSYTEFDLDQDREATSFANEELIAETLNESDVSYEGTDTVADRDVHVIELTDNQTGQTTTLWADQEFWYPLKYESTIEIDGEEVTTTMTYEEVAFNQGVDDDAFEFEPPENATLEEFEPPETRTVESAEDVDAATPFEFVEPELPEKFSFTQGTVSENDGTVTAFVTYEADDESVRFSMANNTERELAGESVEIGDTEGVISEYRDQVSVAWDCDGVRYRLGGNLDRETIVDSAVSVGC